MIKDKIKYFRKLNYLTQEQMASILKITPGGYASWEQGRTEPSIEDIKKICIIFNITADEILEINTNEAREQVKKTYNITEINKNEILQNNLNNNKSININNSFNNSNNGNINF